MQRFYYVIDSLLMLVCCDLQLSVEHVLSSATHHYRAVYDFIIFSAIIKAYNYV